MAQTFDFALDRMGLDPQAYSLYTDYISYLKSVYVFSIFFLN